ncbi:MAG: Hsp20/alpha crystallin family protein [Candidatus Gastranaerophilales bacterium]|nr:Hsp20/alpha crystallin family protein [Candidatus Gastranaerophilales bacterium]
MKYLIKKPDTFLNALNDDINSILHKSFDNMFPEYIFQKELSGIAMPIDVQEFEDSYKLKVELPGIKKDDINVDITKNSVTIDAEKQTEKEEQDKKKKYHKSEFRYGKYSRTIYFPEEINVSDTKAKLKNGILNICLPKLEKEEHKKSKLEIEDK